MFDHARETELQRYAASLLPQRAGGLERAEDPEEAERFVDAALKWAYRERGGAIPEEKRESALAFYRMISSSFEVFAQGLDYGDLEAIILPGLRPVGDVADGKLTLPEAGEFADLTADPALRGRLESALEGVGCVVLPRHPSIPYAGTGVLVGDGLVMTNRHVAAIFSSGLGERGLGLSSEYGVAIDPRRERPGDTPTTYPVKSVRMVHPYWDVALLEVPGLPMKRLRLAPHDPEGGRRRVAVIGYPAFDMRNPADVQATVFNHRYYVKRVAPGYLTGERLVESFRHDVTACTHDASTLGGSSGSAVVDVATGHVLALHFGGRYRDANWAVPMRELARDQRVIDAGVDFIDPRPDPEVPWKSFWQEVENERVSVPVQIHGQAQEDAPRDVPRTGTLRVTVPIEITIGIGQAITAASFAVVSASPAAAAHATAQAPAGGQGTPGRD